MVQSNKGAILWMACVYGETMKTNIKAERGEPEQGQSEMLHTGMQFDYSTYGGERARITRNNESADHVKSKQDSEVAGELSFGW